MVASVGYNARAGGGSYHTRVVVGCGRGQQRGLQQLEQQKVAHVVCAKLSFEAVFCLALRTCHDTCTVSTPGSQLHLARAVIYAHHMGDEGLAVTNWLKGL